MATQMIVRMDPELKEKFDKLARNEGKSTSEMVRGLIEEYVRERDIGPYIDELWDRVGRKLKSKGRTQKDVQRAIREARKARG